MGHDGMLYSLPSREVIADSVEYMVNAHKADAMICISNCDKITPGMLMAAMRLNIPAIFVSGGPMEAGVVGTKKYDLVDAMVMGGDRNGARRCVRKRREKRLSDLRFLLGDVHRQLDELPQRGAGPGAAGQRHHRRHPRQPPQAVRAGRQAASWTWPMPITAMATTRCCPARSPAAARFMNAMALDVAMGGSTNTVLHILAIAHEAGVDFGMADIDAISRRVPCICKVAPSSDYHVQDVNRAGGILRILGELASRRPGGRQR